MRVFKKYMFYVIYHCKKKMQKLINDSLLFVFIFNVSFNINEKLY